MEDRARPFYLKQKTSDDEKPNSSSCSNRLWRNWRARLSGDCHRQWPAQSGTPGSGGGFGEADRCRCHARAPGDSSFQGSRHRFTATFFAASHSLLPAFPEFCLEGTFDHPGVFSACHHRDGGVYVDASAGCREGAGDSDSAPRLECHSRESEPAGSTLRYDGSGRMGGCKKIPPSQGHPDGGNADSSRAHERAGSAGLWAGVRPGCYEAGSPRYRWEPGSPGSQPAGAGCPAGNWWRQLPNSRSCTSRGRSTWKRWRPATKGVRSGTMWRRFVTPWQRPTRLPTWCWPDPARRLSMSLPLSDSQVCWFLTPTRLTCTSTRMRTSLSKQGQHYSQMKRARRRRASLRWCWDSCVIRRRAKRWPGRCAL